MATVLLWTGLTFILALKPVFAALGLTISDVFILVGAIFMVIGMVLLWIESARGRIVIK